MSSLKNLEYTRVPCLDPKECEFQLYWANEREVESHYLKARMQAKQSCVAWLVLHGSARIIDSSTTINVSAGEWVFVRRVDGRQQFPPGTRILSLRFVFRNRGGEDIFERDRHMVFLASSAPMLEMRARELVAVLRPWTNNGNLVTGREEIPLHANLEIEAAFCRWLSVYVAAMASLGARINLRIIDDSRVRKALTLVEQHPFSERICIAAIAKACGLGHNRLGALFKKATGQSPQAYFESLRMQRAQRLLTETTTTIKQITWELGFGSHQHFSHWFKNRSGESPKHYRLSTQGQN